MLNFFHVYTIWQNVLVILTFLILSNCKIKSSTMRYDYYNILDKSPKADMTFIFNNKNQNNKNNQKKKDDNYTKLVDETFPSYQSIFFTDSETITPLYDQNIKCQFPYKKDILFDDNIYYNNDFFKNATKIKIIPRMYAKILLKSLNNLCFNHFIDKWYYKICPFNKAVQTLSFLKKNEKTGKEEKEVNYLGYASNETNDIDEEEYFFTEASLSKETFNQEIYTFFNKSKIVGIYKNVIKIFEPPDKQKEFKKIEDKENQKNEILEDFYIYKYQFKKLEIDFDLKQLEQIENINQYHINDNIKNLDEFKLKNGSKIVTYERIIKKAINKNLFLLNEDLPPIKSGVVNTRIILYPKNQEDYYNKEFFIDKNLLYCENCNLIKCQNNNCYITLSKEKEKNYKIIDFLDEKLVVLDSTINDDISRKSKFALFSNDNYLFLFGKGKINEIQKLKEIKTDDKSNEVINYKYILKGKKLSLEEGQQILVQFKQIKKIEHIIIKDMHNPKFNLLCTINKKLNDTHFEVSIHNINNSSYVNSTFIPLGTNYFIIKNQTNNKNNISKINKSKNIIYNMNIGTNIFNINQLTQITIPNNNFNFDIPYRLFDSNIIHNQNVFHFVLKKLSPWKESYINICLSKNDTCNYDDYEIIIHSKKGILIHNKKSSAEKLIKDSLLFHSNDNINLFTEKIICDIILVNSSLYINVIDISEYSAIKLKYKLKKEDFDNIKYAIVSPKKSNNIKMKGIYITNIISLKLFMNIYFFDKTYMLDNKAIFMETFTNGDYCEAIKKNRTVKVFYMCDESGINNLKIVKVKESKDRLCEYIYYIKSRFLCNPNNIMRTQINSSSSKSFCFSDKYID